jgi:1-acyl-sn-glycerol-3-phosphate acyltransferase
MIWQSRRFRRRNFWYTWHGLNFLLSRLFDWRVSGREHIPMEGPLLVASNHLALLDPPYVGACLRREACFVAKKELFSFAPLGALIRIYNAIPIRRGGWDSAVFRSVKRKLDEGWAVIMFPEGTRSRGRGFLDPKPGVGMIARQSLAPVLPVCISGTDRPLAELLLRKRPLTAAFGPPLTSSQVAEYPDGKEGYQQLSREIMNRIVGLSGQK